MSDFLESTEFYELMQAYRNTPLSDQDAVVSAYESVKRFIHCQKRYDDYDRGLRHGREEVKAELRELLDVERKSS